MERATADERNSGGWGVLCGLVEVEVEVELR